MNKVHRRRIARVAEALRLRLPDKRGVLWTPVALLAGLLGLRVVEEDLPPTVTAVLYKDAQDGLLLIEKSMTEHQRRFVTGIMLGHHELFNTWQHVYTGRPWAVLKPSEKTESGAWKSDEEYAANVFASELLMPEGAVRDTLRKNEWDWLDEGRLEALSQEFNTTPGAMAIRLNTLGLFHCPVKKERRKH